MKLARDAEEALLYMGDANLFGDMSVSRTGGVCLPLLSHTMPRHSFVRLSAFVAIGVAPKGLRLATEDSLAHFEGSCLCMSYLHVVTLRGSRAV